MQALDNYLSSVARTDQIYQFSRSKSYQISPERYRHFKQQAHDVRRTTMGARSIGAKLLELDVPRSGLAVEIGCGTGRLSGSLVLNGHFESYLITDSSGELVKEAKRRIEELESGSEVRFGVMREQDVAGFPDASVGSFFMAAVLHHILDWKQALRTMKKKLQPGGIIFFTEPCLEFGLTLAPLLMTFKKTLEDRGVQLEQRVLKSLRAFAGALKQRGDPFNLEQKKFEDKHFFRLSDMYHFAQVEGMEAHLFPNSSFHALLSQGEHPRGRIKFEKVVRQKLGTAAQLPPAFVDQFMEAMQEPLGFLAHLAELGRGPVAHFSCILQRPRR